MKRKYAAMQILGWALFAFGAGGTIDSPNPGPFLFALAIGLVLLIVATRSLNHRGKHER
jgi:hypothetical protein